MANPFRSQMLDVLAVDGHSTVSALAQRTGQAVGSVGHHLKVLAGTPGGRGPRVGTGSPGTLVAAGIPGTQWSRAEFATDTGAVNAALAAESLALRRQFDRAQEWLANSEAAEDWDDAAFVTQNWLSLRHQ